MKISKVVITLLALTILYACSSNEDDEEQTGESSLLIGKWYRISTEDQDGNSTDDTSTCFITEFTENEYIVTEYIDSDCIQVFSSGSLPYIRVDNLIYFGEVNQDIKVEITELNSTSLKLKSEYSNGNYNFYDVVSYERR